jgi:hypothetical protein
MTNLTKRYLVGGILVEATKSVGGGFYDLTVVATGQQQRYLADVFESVAKPVKFVVEIHDDWENEGGR